MVRWMLLAGLFLGFWMQRDGRIDLADFGAPSIATPGNAQIMDGCDPFPPH
jgi:hypothetical protein